MTTYTIAIPIRRPPMTANEARRAHWTKLRSAKADAARLVGWTAKATWSRSLRFDQVHVLVTWFAPDAIRRDPDGLSVFTKAALDEIVRLGHLPDDSSLHVLGVEQRVVVDRDRPRIEITLTTQLPTTGEKVAPSPLPAPGMTEGIEDHR